MGAPLFLTDSSSSYMVTTYGIPILLHAPLLISMHIFGRQSTHVEIAFNDICQVGEKARQMISEGPSFYIS
jgi:hypothetical protein